MCRVISVVVFLRCAFFKNNLRGGDQHGCTVNRVSRRMAALFAARNCTLAARVGSSGNDMVISYQRVMPDPTRIVRSITRVLCWRRRSMCSGSFSCKESYA